MARPRRSEPATIVEHRAKSRSEQATRKMAEHRAKAREEPEGAARRRASAKDFATQVRSQHAAMFRRDTPEGVRLKRRNCSGVSTTEAAPRRIPQSSSSSGRRASARGDTVAGGTTPNGTRSTEEHVATPIGRKKRTAARQDLKCERGSRHRGTPASTGRETQRPALRKKVENMEEKPRNVDVEMPQKQRLKQNRQRAVLRRTRDSSAERGSTIETVGSTDGGIACIRKKGAQSQEGSPRSRASSAAQGSNMLHTSENISVGSERSSSGSSDVSVSEGGSDGGVETGVPRNAMLEEIVPFIVESLKRIELRLHSLERRCDGFSEAIDELKEALSTRQQPHRPEEHIPSTFIPLPGVGLEENCGDRSLPISIMQRDGRDNEVRSPPAIADPTSEVLPQREGVTALRRSGSPPTSVGGNATAIPCVLATIERREMMADGRNYMTGGAEDATFHDVAVESLTISSEKDEDEIATGEGREFLNEENEANSRNPKSLDSLARYEGGQYKGMHVELPYVQTLGVDTSYSSSSSCPEKEGVNETTGVTGAVSTRWPTVTVSCEETCGKEVYRLINRGIYDRDWSMGAADANDGQDVDDEYVFEPMQLDDERASLGVSSGGGSGAFNVRSTQVNRSENAVNDEGASPQVADGGNERSLEYPWASVHADVIEKALGMMTLEELNHRMEMHGNPVEPLVEELEGVDKLAFPPLREPPRGKDAVIPEYIIDALLDAPDEEAMAAVKKVKGFPTPDRDTVDNERWIAYEVANEYLAKRRAERRLGQSSYPAPYYGKISDHMSGFPCFRSMAEAVSQVTHAVLEKDGANGSGKKPRADPIEMLHLKSSYEEDQHFIKCKVVEDILKELLDDTVKECKRIYRGSKR